MIFLSNCLHLSQLHSAALGSKGGGEGRRSAMEGTHSEHGCRKATSNFSRCSLSHCTWSSKKWVLLCPSFPTRPSPDRQQPLQEVALGTWLLPLSTACLRLLSSDQQQSLWPSPCAPARGPGPGQSPRARSAERVGRQAPAGAQHQEGLPLAQDGPYQLPGAGVTPPGPRGTSVQAWTTKKMLARVGKDRSLQCLPPRSDRLASAVCPVVWPGAG